MKMKIKLKGTRAMLMHNGRLANPIDPYTKKLKALTSKKKKTDEDLVSIMIAEARAGAYETNEGYMGVPTANVYGTIFEAAKAFKLGKMVKMSLRYEDKTELVLVDGKKILVDKFLSESKNIDYRLVVVQRSRVMRSRPIVKGWETTHEFELDEKFMDKREFAPILKRAGSVGLCDMRPMYGTFEVEVL